MFPHSYPHWYIAEEDDANLVNDALSSFKAKYQKIAIEFGLPPDLVAEIKENNPRNAGNALNDVIVAWVKQEHNVGKFGHPCWRKVVKAALGAGNKLQAKKIAAAHPGKFDIEHSFFHRVKSYVKQYFCH